MSDQDIPIEDQARAQGWRPKEEFKGDESKWVDAATYIERGEHIIPIVQSNNKRMKEEIEHLKAEVKRLNDNASESKEAMKAFKEFHEQASKAEIEKARKELIASLRQAKEDGDIDEEVKLTADLSKFDAAQQTAKEIKKEAQAYAEPGTQQLHPDLQAWMAENPWYGQDFEKTALMDGVSRKMKAEGVSLSVKDFLLEAASRVSKRFGEDYSPPAFSKVEGGRSSGSVKSSKSYESLPIEAQMLCESQARVLVGPGKKFKTLKEWQTYFTKSQYEV